jgi:hypothetical protein
MSNMDRDARKQVLLTRIAFERIELRRDVARLEQAARIPNLLRAAIGANLAPVLGKSRASRKRDGFLDGALMGSAPEGGWMSMALSMLRRYRVAAALLGSAVPLFKKRRLVTRLVKLGAVGAAAWFGWRAWSGRDRAR